MKISIDIGNGYIKAINEKGDKVHFPSITKINIDANVLESKNKYKIIVDGQSYFVGKLALIKGGLRHWHYNVSSHEDTLIFVALCCNLLAKNEEIELKLGLPYSLYKKSNKGEKLIENLSKKVIKTEYEKEEKLFNIKSVHVYPQGVGAYFSNLYDINGHPLKDADKYIKSIFIDIGYRTVDVVAFELIDNTFELIETNSFSLEDSGMNKAIKLIAEKASKEFSITENDVEYAIQNNNSAFENMYGTIDLNLYEIEAYQELAREIGYHINANINSDIARYKNIFITGGGAEKLYPYLSKFYLNLKLQNDYVFCNAKGYLALSNNK